MHLTFNLTPACNMQCDYCYAPPHSGAAMSEEVGLRALEYGAELNDSSCGVVFFGGEPLLHKDLIRTLVKHAREMERHRAGRFHFKMTTNGVLLDDAFLDFSAEEDILIAMSFDGVREAHDAHRRFPDGSSTYDLLLGRLKRLLEARPYASVLMVVNPDTARYLCASVECLLDLGCRYIIVSLNYAADWHEEEMAVLEKQYKRLASLYVRWTQQERKFYLSPFEVKLSSHINRHCHQKERCELAEQQLSVDMEGFLYPCVQFPRAGAQSDWCIGNIFDGIDESKRQAIVDMSKSEKKTCRDCAIADRCNHTCGCLNWQTTGDINTVSPVLCRYEQMLVPIADGIGKKLYKKRNPHFLHKHYNAAYPILSLLEDNLDE
jgi:uncharacterized protein